MFSINLWLTFATKDFQCFAIEEFICHTGCDRISSSQLGCGSPTRCDCLLMHENTQDSQVRVHMCFVLVYFFTHFSAMWALDQDKVMHINRITKQNWTSWSVTRKINSSVKNSLPHQRDIFSKTEKQRLNYETSQHQNIEWTICWSDKT